MIRKFSSWLAIGFLITNLLTSCEKLRITNSLTGIVLDETGALTGAIVRIKATNIFTQTDENGHFTLSGLVSDEPVFLTAWASGYYIAGVEALPGDTEVKIVLHQHHNSDNSDYAWLPSQFHPGQGEDQGCAQCHSSQGSELGFSLPVDEWLLDVHSQSALNSRFLNMYSGTDLRGNQSPLTDYGYSRDYGRFPLRPDPSQSYYGPGYKLDFPETAGNCAACHTPLAAVNNPYGVDPTQLTGVETEGVSCDFCHKVWDVKLDPSSNLPYANMPGVLSFEFRRPPEGHQFFAGPLDDVAPGEDTYSPLQQQSEFCAPCHFGVFWDTLIYNSFGEWLESPYSDPERARTAGLSSSQSCQDCHMPPLGVTHFALPEPGGVARDPNTIFSHRMPGASDEKLLQNAVTMNVSARRDEQEVIVDVTLINDQTGHHVPTDSPLRQMILLVQAMDMDGEILKQVDGPTIPEWGGTGNPEEGYYAYLAGKGYAKILIELWTEVSPTGAYWNPTRVASDNRLAAFETDTSTFIFAAPEGDEITVAVTLLFRRAFIELMDQKGWEVPDIIMEEEILQVP